jgi:hypothetical protein
MAKKQPAAQSNEIPATNTEKKRNRAKSEYAIERNVKFDTTDGDRDAWEPIFERVFEDTAQALKFLSDPENKIDPGDYRIIVVKWAKTVKVVQQSVTKFE